MVDFRALEAFSAVEAPPILEVTQLAFQLPEMNPIGLEQKLLNIVSDVRVHARDDACPFSSNQRTHKSSHAARVLADLWEQGQKAVI